MPFLISCTACAFQQVVYDEREFDELKEQHESKSGGDHTVEIGD